MIRQYHAPRRQGGDNPLGVGVIPAGAILYLQPDGYWRERFRGRPVCRNPFIVEGFLNGLLGAACRNPDTGHWESRFISRRSDMAVVRSLRNGRRRTVPVRILILHDDEGLTLGPSAYPDLPSQNAASVARRRVP